MAYSGYTKSERGKLRELAGDVYEAELNALLEDIAEAFDQWRSGQLLGSELSAVIHEFHQGASREIWSAYQGLKDHEIVARGVALGIIGADKLPESLRHDIESLAESLSRR